VEKEREKESGTVIGKPSKSDGDVLGLKSIQFRMWLSFVALTALTLVVLWVAQVVFYTAGFNDMSKSEVKRIGDELKTGVFDPGFQEKLRVSAISGGFSALLLDRKTGLPLYYANANGSKDPEHMDYALFNEIVNSHDFKSKVDEVGRVYTFSTERHGDFIVYGALSESGVGGGNDYCLCLIKPFVKADASVGILRNQLVLVTVMCLFVSMVLALTFSRTISRPITEFSKAARKLGKGDYSVRFTGNGWTEIDELAETLNYATEEIGKTETVRRDFFANVSHDLRTPLTMVRAYAEMIKDISGEDKEKREKHAQIIMDEADRLTLLVGDILELSKLQAGTAEYNIGRTDIAALAETVVGRFAAMGEKNGFEFESRINCRCDALCDGKRIEQALYNLISNAMNYSRDIKKVTVEVAEKESTVRIEVSDRGKGIAPEEIEKVWDRYYRANQTKRTSVGTGLGLPIVKSILEKHGAAYGVDSATEDNAEGRESGTTFWFELEKFAEPQSALPPSEKKRRRKEAKPKERSKDGGEKE